MFDAIEYFSLVVIRLNYAIDVFESRQLKHLGKVRGSR